MSDRCAPPPELLAVSGWYWVTGPHTTGPLYWVGARTWCSGQWQRDGDDQSPEDAYRIGCRYLGPVTPHAEVEALRVEVERLRAAVGQGALRIKQERNGDDD